MSECLHPEHNPNAVPVEGRIWQSKSRCLCYDCLLQRDTVLGDAISRLVYVIETQSIGQIQSAAQNADAALWDHRTYISSGAAETIRRAVAPAPASGGDGGGTAMTRAELIAWLNAVRDAAKREAAKWGRGVPPVGIPCTAEGDAERAVVRDNLRRMEHAAHGAMVALGMWPDVNPRKRRHAPGGRR